MDISAAIFVVFETLILFGQLGSWLSRRHDKSRSRFLLLTVAFILYNFGFGLFPNEELTLSMVAQSAISFSTGIFLATYYFYYLVRELEIIQTRIFSIKGLFLGLFASLVLCFFGVYLITGEVFLSRQLFILLPLFFSVYFCVRTFQFLLIKRAKHAKEKTPFKFMVYTSYIGIWFWGTLPLSVFVNEFELIEQAWIPTFQIVNNTLVNFSFLLGLFAYIKRYLFQAKVEYELLSRMGHFQQSNSESAIPLEEVLERYSLTSREKEVAFMILQNLTYKEIAEDMFIAPSTVSKHGSNIFKKVDCPNKQEFIAKFSRHKELELV